MKTRIIGIGNTILSDDGIGIYTVRELSRRLHDIDSSAKPDIVETEVAGFALMELMSGWDRVILVDSILFDDIEPGTVVRLGVDNLRTSLKLRSVHEIDLPTALALGRHLGLPMPSHVSVFGIQAEDTTTLGESLSSAGKRGMEEAVDLIMKEIVVN